MPSPTDSIEVRHTIFSPLTLSLDANGSFGVAQGTVALMEGNVSIKFKEAKDIQTLKPYLKQNKEGWYYETSF